MVYFRLLMKFQSTPSARRATFRVFLFHHFFVISIHALREESDFLRCLRLQQLLHFNPRPPRGERRTVYALFPLRKNFNPRPPRGERRHASPIKLYRFLFQSTPSARRATKQSCRAYTTTSNFNPRPPRGERQARQAHSATTQTFQSTPSARRATSNSNATAGRSAISIHALREESDGNDPYQHSARNHFNPRPPRGERRRLHGKSGPAFAISIHALREESDK